MKNNCARCNCELKLSIMSKFTPISCARFARWMKGSARLSKSQRCRDSPPSEVVTITSPVSVSHPKIEPSLQISANPEVQHEPRAKEKIH